MNRRAFTAGLCSCAAAALTGCVTDGMTPQAAGAVSPHLVPGHRPGVGTDEGGLWAQMDRAEAELKRSRFLVRDQDVRDYVNDIVCRLSRDYCSDVRVYVVQTPHFNAMMAPNGMMQIWTGLLLRVQNEAQLAAVIGHELGHYLRQHSLQRWRDARNKTDIAALFSFAGLPGLIAQVGLIASIYSFSREQEREADAIGLELMANAGYRPLEAVRVWEQLIAERDAAPNKNENRDIFFASHPAPEERVGNLRTQAGGKFEPVLSDGTRQAQFRDRLKNIRSTLLADELKLRQFEKSEVVFNLLIKEIGEDSELYFYQGEVYRQRNAESDPAKAVAAFNRAIEIGMAPAETYRSLGLVQMREKDLVNAKVSFMRYLELSPSASDRGIVLSYINQ